MNTKDTKLVEQLVGALEGVSKALAWLNFGDCRAINSAPVPTANDAYKTALDALTAAKAALEEPAQAVPDLANLIDRLRSFEQDHGPNGWPAIQMRDISALLDVVQSTALPVGELTPDQVEKVFQETRYDEGVGTHTTLTSAILAAARSQPVREPLTSERSAAQIEYSTTVHNYAEAPIGSRDWTLYWAGWLARSTHNFGITQGGKV